MAIVINGVLCQELVADYEEEVELQRGPQAIKGFLCPWGSRFQVAIGLLGLSHTTSIGGFITLQLPLQHPELTTTYAHSVSIKGSGAPTEGVNQIQWPYAKVYVHYQVFPWSFAALDNPFQQLDPVSPKIFCEQRLASSAEWITIPGRHCYFAGTLTNAGQDFAIKVGIVEMILTFKDFPYMPTPTSLTYAGGINNALFLGVPAGKLLFNGITTQQGATSDGTLVQSEATYSFTARTQPWDYVFNGKTGVEAWQQIVSASGTPIGPPRLDFTTIFPSAYSY